jgi:hypothetical protein
MYVNADSSFRQLKRHGHLRARAVPTPAAAQRYADVVGKRTIIDF